MANGSPTRKGASCACARPAAARASRCRPTKSRFATSPGAPTAGRSWRTDSARPAVGPYSIAPPATRERLWADHDPLKARIEDTGAAATAKVSDLRQLTWSRNGRFLAGIVNGREGQELWTIAADGSLAQARRVPHRIAFPAWTPRGEVACIATIDGRPRITSPCGGAVIRTDPGPRRLRAVRVRARRRHRLRVAREFVRHGRSVGDARCAADARSA